MQDGYRILGSGKSGKMAKIYQHHKFPPCLGNPSMGERTRRILHTFSDIASRVYSCRNHRTSHPVPIPCIPVLHFATKPQHSLLRVEKMSNFALVVPSSIEEGDRFSHVAPSTSHHRSKSSRPWTSTPSAPSSTTACISSPLSSLRCCFSPTASAAKPISSCSPPCSSISTTCWPRPSSPPTA